MITLTCGHVAPTPRERDTVRVKLAAILTAIAALGSSAQLAYGEDVSQPAILQLFEAKWTTIENRLPDVLNAGYGQLWLPSPSRASSGNLSVGYDMFDRFDLGGPRNETLYGTEQSLRTQIDAAHKAGLKVDVEMIWNHNGFGDSNDASFVAKGGYPGFALTLPGDAYGDFHNPSATSVFEQQISGLADIAQEKNYQFIRHPVESGNPQNIPAGTIYNKPNPSNAQFYPDRDLPGVTLTDPALGTTVARYSFNTIDPLAGDAVAENATGLLMRSAQWMVEVIGVDGFRIDAAKHIPSHYFNYYDQAVFRANPRLNLDGSFQPVFAYSEVLDGNKGTLQPYVRQTLPNRNAIAANDTTVRGNRDVLDFPLFFAMRDNLTSNGTINNWHKIRNASQDVNDDGLRNGSQGVAFVDSHDDIGGGRAYLKNLAYAYILMRPGQAIVYLNAREFGNNRDFPNDGKDDALGGYYGSTITKLVDIRNSHGRGDFHERWIDDAYNPNGFSNVYVYEREKSAIVGLNSRNDSVIETRTVNSSFDPGTVLVELTGNAASSTVDPNGLIPETVRVRSDRKVVVAMPGNQGHGRGYVVYGVAPPQGSLTLSGTASTLAGATPTSANNGTARLASIDVITGDSFTVQLTTNPVTLPAPAGESSPVRDVHADGDLALLKLDGGIDLNGNAMVDYVVPGSVKYGFEEFGDVNAPGYVWYGGANVGTGTGSFTQTIDASQLSEGRHYITARAFRHRDSTTGGDGGPDVFTEFTKTIYIDRLRPEAEVLSFAPYASNPNNQANRDLVVESTDGTANSMRMFLDLPANMTDAEILAMAASGQGGSSQYDRNSFIKGFTGVRGGNHVATVVTYEETGNFNIQRLTGLSSPFGASSGLGAGFGDLNGNGVITSNDLAGIGNNSFEDVLFSQGDKFNAAGDVDADGRVTDRDLFALGSHLVAGGASTGVLDLYSDLLVRRGDVDGDHATSVTDLNAIYDAAGQTDWLLDLDADGIVGIGDVAALVDDSLRTSRGDFDLNRTVDGDDFLVWQRNVGSGGRFDEGDADLDGDVDGDDLQIWLANVGRTAPLAMDALEAAVSIPEPSSFALVVALVPYCQGAFRRGLQNFR